MNFLDGMSMKYIAGLLSSLVIVAVASAGMAWGQANPATLNSAFVSNTGVDSSGPGDSLLVIRKRVSEVDLLLTATDKHGRFVQNLNANDFKILDDHKPPEAIVNFRRDTDLPLELGLLLDTSGSIKSRFDFEKDAAIGFLQHTIRPNFDSAFVEGFSRKADLSQDFTDNMQSLAAGVQNLRAGGGTALYDAIYRVCRDKLSKEKSLRPARRALIVVSDGEDNQSQVTEAQAIAMAQRAQVIIYTISTDDSGLILRGDYVLQQIAESTGGRAFLPYKLKDIKSSFDSIQDELRSQYVVSYRPADFDANGRYRPIEILSQKKDIQLRARKGYYAPSE